MSEYRGGQARRPFEKAIAGQEHSGKVPAWTPEDEANLKRRVRAADRQANVRQASTGGPDFT